VKRNLGHRHHDDDDDFVIRARALYRGVLDDDAREQLACRISRDLEGVEPPVLARAIEYWARVDPDLGARLRRLTHPASGQRPEV
jgi:catalase